MSAAGESAFLPAHVPALTYPLAGAGRWSMSLRHPGIAVCVHCWGLPFVSDGNAGDASSAAAALADALAACDDLRARNAELAQALAARDSFLAVATHELRNPMTPLIGQLQRLHRRVAARRCTLDEVEQDLTRIVWLTEHYVRRATTLLDVSRITSGKLRLELTAFDLSDLVRQVTAAHQHGAQYARSQVSVRVPPETGVVADRLAVEQILDNLLLNAIKYGAGQPVDVAVEPQADSVRLVVRDRGIGISAQEQARIFERFERAVAAASQSGFGVGLWVVKQLTDAMGGRVTVDSVPGEGTTFAVTLPRQVVQE
jgi:two-component system OmpR family sensor kinase